MIYVRRKVFEVVRTCPKLCLLWGHKSEPISRQRVRGGRWSSVAEVHFARVCPLRPLCPSSRINENDPSKIGSAEEAHKNAIPSDKFALARKLNLSTKPSDRSQNASLGLSIGNICIKLQPMSKVSQTVIQSEESKRKIAMRFDY